MEFTPAFFAGGRTCLDFCNTFDHLHTPPAFDFLTDPAILLRWGEAAGCLAPGSHHPGENAEAGLHQARVVRAQIFRLLEPFTRQEMPSGKDLEAFNHLFQEQYGKLEILATEHGFLLECRTTNDLEKIVCEAVRSTADLLLSNQTGRIKCCTECGWLFFDSTRNRSRRWCDMKICGNKAKARRHYARVKEQREIRRSGGN